MKKITYLIVSITMLFLTSCEEEDFVVPPSGAILEDDALSNLQGFESLLRGAYGKFLASGYYGSGDNSDWVVVWDVIADNLIQAPVGRSTNLTAYQWAYNANTTPIPLFYRGYEIAEQANYILDNSDLLVNYTSDQAVIDNIVGQALAIRAIAHFDMVRTFSKIPTQSSDANSSLGIHYSDVFDPFAVYPRDLTVSEVYQRVLQDLNSASTLVSETDAAYLNKAAIYGILSRVYLHMGDWQAAVSAAELSIQNGAEVASMNQFPGIWTDANSAGVLWKVVNTAVLNDNTIGVAYNQPSGDAIVSEFVPTYDFYSMYTDEDVRKDSYFLTSETAGDEYNHIIKYAGRATGNIGVVDGKYIRSAEVYLNKAEAHYELGQEDLAREALNEVRVNRYEDFDVNSSNETGQILEDAIQNERRLELAFEGDRFFTLKRRGEDVERSSTTGPFADGSGVPNAYTYLDSSSHLWQLPIPQDAININPLLEQNAGY
ncbi:RagB/SusD family nutrient uptake outer membrane protein [Flavobacteriaceae bacterium Ap0902]|nr:RagB/SusD family nutrient uptake outer membrane protein [Flavobacteriaceae bacterium Ap0902]